MHRPAFRLRQLLWVALFFLLARPVQGQTAWPFDLEHVQLRLKADPRARTLEGTVTLRMVALADGVKSVELAASGQIKVGGVETAGKKLEHRHEPPRLVVAIEPARKGDRVELSVSYRVVEPRLGVYFVGPDRHYPDLPWQMYTQSEPYEGPHWFPGYHEPADKATSELVVSVPAPFSAISNGRLKGSGEKDGWRTFHWAQEVPHSTYLIMLAVGEYVRVALPGGNGRVPMAYHVRREDVPRAGRSFERTGEMMRFFEKLTGQPFPFEKYDQIVVEEFKWGGMENTSATTLNSGTLHDERAALDTDSEGLVAHELAHSWYGNAVTCRTFADIWLNEGFATYLAHLWTAERRGEDRFRWDIERSLEWYLGADDGGPQPVVRPKFTDAEALFDGRSYAKGAAVLHMLRQVLGDEAFFKGLKLYTQRAWLKPAVTTDLQRAMEEASGRALEGFFQQWLHQPGYPRFKVAARWEGGELALTVEQTQDAAKMAVFKTPVDVAVQVGKARVKRRFEISGRSEVLRWKLPERPRWVRFNDGGWVISRVEYLRPIEELAAQAREDADVLGRYEAVVLLEKEKGRLDAQEALAAVLAGDSFWGVRQKAAQVLSAAGGPLALAALRRAAADSDSKVRTTVAEALGKHRSPETEAVLRSMLADKSYWVVCEALRGLAMHKVADAAKLLADHAQLPSHQHLFRRTTLRVHADRGEQADLQAVLAANQLGVPRDVRQEAISLLPKFAGKFPDRVRDELLALLKLESFHLRRAAAQALKDLADPQAREALQQAVSGDREHRVRQAAQEALAAIEKKEKAKGSLDGRMADMKRQLDKKKLEAESAALDVKILELQLRKLEIEKALQAAGAGK